MERWTRPALAAAGTLCLILGFRYGGLIPEPELYGAPPDINGYAWFLSLLGVYLLVRAAGGHRTATGCLVSIVGILLLSSPFWGSTITFFLMVLPLMGASIGAVLISAAVARRAERDRALSVAATPADVDAVFAEGERLTPARRLLTIVGVVLILASIAGFLFISHLISQIPMEKAPKADGT